MDLKGLKIFEIKENSEGSYSGTLLLNEEPIGIFHYDSVCNRGSISFNYNTSKLGNGVDCILNGGYETYQKMLTVDHECRKKYEDVLSDITAAETIEDVDEFELLLNGKSGFIEARLFAQLFMEATNE